MNKNPIRGFNDYPPKEHQKLKYLFAHWEKMAILYGFEEYDTPILENVELYKKKSGEEVLNQLYKIAPKKNKIASEKKEKEIALRPEFTASLMRILAFNQRNQKPMKWFSIGKCFRYEKPQQGRQREFFQFNADIIGEKSPLADAELIALLIDTLLSFGFEKEDFKVHISDRSIWQSFFKQHKIEQKEESDFLQIIDKWEKEDSEKQDEELKKYNLNKKKVENFMTETKNKQKSKQFQEIEKNLKLRNLQNYICFDPKITRGLAYYTGIVFEAISTEKKFRSIAGGGRYDKLASSFSEEKNNLPACGFAIGDCVLKLLIEKNSQLEEKRKQWLQKQKQQIFLVSEEETSEEKIVEIVSDLRQKEIPVQYSFEKDKNKQFKQAEKKATHILRINQEGKPYQLKEFKSGNKESIQNLDEIVEKWKYPPPLS